MSDTDSVPAYHPVTANNHSGWVIATGYIFLIFSLLAVTAKILSRISLTKLTLYDGLLIAATTLAVVQTICITSACKYGLGKHRDTLSEDSFELESKFFYSAQILLIAALALTKASVTSFILVLSPERKSTWLCRIFLVIVGLWATSAIFALSFQCGLPNPWLFAPGKCIDQQALYIGIGIVNILTDLALIILPGFMMWKVQTAVKTKWQVIALFAVRIVVPIFNILQLSSLPPLFTSHHSDPTWHAVAPTIWSQIMLHSSILTACLPSLKRMLDNLRSGAAAVTIDGPYELSVSGGTALGISSGSRGGKGSGKEFGGSRSGVMDSGKGGSSNNKSGNGIGGGGKRGGEKLQDREISSSKFGGYGLRNSKGDGNGRIGHMNSIMSRNNDSEMERSDSIEGLTDNVIVQTLDYRVDVEGHSLREERSGHGHSEKNSDSEGGSIKVIVR